MAEGHDLKYFEPQLFEYRCRWWEFGNGVYLPHVGTKSNGSCKIPSTTIGLSPLSTDGDLQISFCSVFQGQQIYSFPSSQTSAPKTLSRSAISNFCSFSCSVDPSFFVPNTI